MNVLILVSSVINKIKITGEAIAEQINTCMADNRKPNYRRFLKQLIKCILFQAEVKFSSKSPENLKCKALTKQFLRALMFTSLLWI